MPKLSSTLTALMLAGALGFASGQSSRAWAQSEPVPSTSPTPALQGVASATELTIHGKVVAVDKSRRLVTLEGKDGRKVTLKVENPVNLAAAKVGVPVVARFYEIASIRKKKDGENIPPATLKEGIASTAPGGGPGGVAAGTASIVVSVVSIDKAHGTITVKGPDEAVETVKARNPKNLDHVKVGDELVVTLWRAIVLTLEKESGN
jgi:hypothetical protein